MAPAGSAPPIRVVTFDLDDTLWPVGPVIVSAEQAMWRWLEMHCPRLTERYDRDALGEIRTAVLAAQPSLRHDISALRVRVLTEALAGSGYPAAESRRLAAEAFGVFMQGRHDVEYYEDVRAILGTLGERYLLGVVSNGNADVRRLAIGEFFDFAISAANVWSSKPDPHLFEAALRAAHCAAREMVHVGDHHEHDVAGAQALGIHTVWINRKGDPFPGECPPSAEIASLAELPDALARIERRARAAPGPTRLSPPRPSRR